MTERGNDGRVWFDGGLVLVLVTIGFVIGYFIGVSP